MPGRPTTLIAPMLLAILALAAGCGGDGDGGATPGSPAGAGPSDSGEAERAAGGEAAGAGGFAAATPTKRQFVKRANAICAERRKERNAALEEYVEQNPADGERTREEAFVEGVRETLPAGLEGQAAEIRALGVPRGDEERVGRILASMEGYAAAVADLESVDEMAAIDRGFLRLSAAAKRYGLEECARG